MILLLAGKTERDLEEVKRALSTKFDIKDLGELSYFLGVKVEQREQHSKVWNARLQTSKHTSEQQLQAHQSYRQR